MTISRNWLYSCVTRVAHSYILVHVAEEVAQLLEPELRLLLPEELDRMDALQLAGIRRQQRLDEAIAQVGDVGIIVGDGLEEERPVDGVVQLGTLEDVVELVELLDRIERTAEEKAGTLLVP